MNSRTAQFSLWTDVSNATLLEKTHDKKLEDLNEDNVDIKVCATHFTCYFCKRTKKLREHHYSTVDDLIVIASNPSRYLLIDEVITCGCNTENNVDYEVYVLDFLRSLPYVLLKKGCLTTCVYNLRHNYFIQIVQFGSSSTIQRRAIDFSKYDPFYYNDIRKVTLFHILIKACLFQ
jgi:hypothetical protein